MRSSRILLLLLVPFLVIVVVIAGAAGWLLYRNANRPTVDRLGGTVLVYEVDEERQPEGPKPDPEALVVTLKRRLDPYDLAGINVRLLNSNRVEISIPRRNADHEADLERAKKLISRTGKLEFRIVANIRDDEGAILVAREYLDSLSDENTPEEIRKERQQALDGRAERGLPPPPPRPVEGEKFPASVNGDSRSHSYSWVELSAQERKTLNLDNAAENEAERGGLWREARDARQGGKALVLSGLQGGTLLYSRNCINKNLPAEERKEKRYEYFTLTREPEAGKEVTGEWLIDVSSVQDPRSLKPAISFVFSKRGGDLFYEFTSLNRPDRSGGFYRHLAIIIDDKILSAPRLNEPIRDKGQIAGQFTKQEVDNLVEVLRSGALPMQLRPEPVSESTIEPRK